MCELGVCMKLGLGTSREPCAALACCNWVTKSLAEVQAERAMKGMAHWGLTPEKGLWKVASASESACVRVRAVFAGGGWAGACAPVHTRTHMRHSDM